jgi:hypothetical protein
METLRIGRPRHPEDDKESKLVFKPPLDNESAPKGSFGLTPEINDRNGNQTKIRPDLQENELLDAQPNQSVIKRKVLYLLRAASKPVSYYDIAKYISKDSPNYNFETILKELDQLKKDGKVTGQVSAGKLYFQIKN